MKQRKIVFVGHCEHCPYSFGRFKFWGGRERYTCVKTGKPLHHIGQPAYNIDIPAWCPLPGETEVGA